MNFDDYKDFIDFKTKTGMNGIDAIIFLMKELDELKNKQSKQI